MQETLEAINGRQQLMGQTREENIALNFAKGKALNIKADYDVEAFECLSKCIKLNPLCSESWNQLAECYWKQSNIDSARNCFEESIKLDPNNKSSIRSLSILLRQIPVKSPDEKFQLLHKSLEKAKEAVNLDMTDGARLVLIDCHDLLRMKQQLVHPGKRIPHPLLFYRPEIRLKSHEAM